MPDALAVGESTGHLFLLGSCLTTIDLRTRGTLGTARAGRDPISIVVAERLNRVVVTNAHDPDRMHSSVSLFDARTGALLHTTRFDSPALAGTISERAGHIFVLTSRPLGCSSNEGSVHILDARSGSAIGVIPVAGSGLAVDERLNRVFIQQRQCNPEYGGIIALDAVTGGLVGKLSYAGDWKRNRVCGGSQVMVDQRIDRVYSVSEYGMCVVDARTLRLISTIDLGNTGFVVEAVDERAGVLVVAETPDIKFATTALALLDARDGAYTGSSFPADCKV